MWTSRETIKGWFERGLRQGATHLIVVCDTYDHDDYPVFVEKGQDPRKVAEEYNGKNMQRIMEVYALHLPMDPQLNESRAFHYEMPPEAKP